MGFRFRKTIPLLPGVRLNLAKTGVSLSLGRKGATVNLSKRGVAGTVGLPGSGMSYRHAFSKGQVIVLLLVVVVVLGAALLFVLARGGTLPELPGGSGPQP